MSTFSDKALKLNYFGKEIKVLKSFGVSFTGHEGVVYKIYSWLFLFTTLYVYPLLDTYELTKHDWKGIVKMMTYQIGSVLAMAKITVVLRNRIKIGKLLKKLEATPFAPNSDRGGDLEETLIRNCVRVTTAQTLIYWIAAGLTFFATFSYSLTKRITSSDYHDWQFSSGPLTILNVTYSPNFEISWTYQCVSVLYIGTAFTTIDLLLAAVLAHISYQFKILQNCFRLLVKTSNDNIHKNAADIEQHSDKANFDHCDAIPWKILDKSLRQTVQYHLEITDLVQEVEEVFSSLLLCTFLATLCLICFSANSASTAENQAVQLVHLGEAFASVMQVLLVCYWGEQVVQESQLVRLAAYEADFVGTDLRFQKSLVLIMRRSQNPSILTARKFTVVSLTTFVWILRSSYSAFMILYRANQNKV